VKEPSAQPFPPQRRVDVVAPPTIPAGDSDVGVGTLTAEEPETQSELAADAAMWAIVLAGGIGSRFWPLSSPERPKQLLNLIGDRPLIAETVARLQPLVPPDRVLVLTSRDIAPAIHAAIPEVPEQNMLVEPRPLGTAAALAWGAKEVARRAGPETIFACIHADLAVGFPELFRDVVRQAARIAASGDALVAVGARPTRPETGFGYMRLGAHYDSSGVPNDIPVRRVAAFVEKPGLLVAEELIQDGAWWNTGVFVWRASVVLDAIERLVVEVAPGLGALDAKDYERFASLIQSTSLERGLLERSRQCVAVLGDFAWDDVGTWASLRRARELDDNGNGAIGQVHFVEATSNVVHAEKGTVVLYGCSSMLVVTLDGLTLVTPLERATDLKPLLDALPGDIRA
jgi:mannose-1-phosphate guanylyltransferase